MCKWSMRVCFGRWYVTGVFLVSSFWFGGANNLKNVNCANLGNPDACRTEETAFVFEVVAGFLAWVIFICFNVSGAGKIGEILGFVVTALALLSLLLFYSVVGEFTSSEPGVALFGASSSTGFYLVLGVITAVYSLFSGLSGGETNQNPGSGNPQPNTTASPA